MAGERALDGKTVIVLDTTQINSAVYQVESGTVHELHEEVKRRKALLAFTDVQVGEIRAQITEGIQQTRKVITALQAHAGKHNIRKPDIDAKDAGIPLPRFLQNASIRKALDGVVNTAESLVVAFDQLLKSDAVVTISSGHVTADRILPGYFEARAPFSPGRKKSEFPDAFAIEALKDFALKHPESRIIVVSADSDWRNALASDPNFLFYADAQEALQHLRDLDAIAKLLSTLEAGKGSSQPQLRDYVADEFSELDFSLDQDWGADIEDVDVSGSAIDRIDVTSFRNHVAKIEFTSTVDFTCVARYPSDDYGHWEQSHDYATIKTSTAVNGSATVTLNDEENQVEDISDVSLNGPIQVSMFDSDDINIRTKRWHD